MNSKLGSHRLDAVPANLKLDGHSPADDVFRFVQLLSPKEGSPSDGGRARELILQLAVALARGRALPTLAPLDAASILAFLATVDMAPVAEGPGEPGYSACLMWVARSIAKL